MSGGILVAYATRKGSTREVAETIANVLAAAGLVVEVRPAAEVDSLDGYAGVVLGGGLYMGKLHRDARRFLARFRATLADLPTAVFAMGPSTLEDDDVRRSRAQLDRALEAVPEVEPRFVAIFGGVVDPATFRFPLNRIPASDARYWNQIRSWGAGIARAFGARQPAGVRPAQAAAVAARGSSGALTK